MTRPRPGLPSLSALALLVATASACRTDPPAQATTQIFAPKPGADTKAAASDEVGEADEAGEAGEADDGEDAGTETGDPFSGEKAHVIPFADRTSMGYLLLLPPSKTKPEPPTRERLQALVQQAYPDRRNDGELDLLMTLIETEPHTTDLGFNGELDAPSLDEAGPDSTGDDDSAELERGRVFDLIGVHIELIHIGVGDDTTIPTAVLEDPILTRALDDGERASLLGRDWALLLRADYRNQHAVRGLRLHQTLVRVAAEHYGALIHDPDTRETMNVEAFTERRLRAAAGNVVDQIAIVPFPDPRHEGQIRLGTRGMRRFGSVDVELEGLAADPQQLQRASDLLAGLALVLTREGEVDESGFAVAVPSELEIDCASIQQSYSERDYQPTCSGSVFAHLVERAPQEHDPSEHVVARLVAPRPQSDAPDYDHPQWIAGALDELFSPR